MQPTAELTGIIDPPKCTYGIYDIHTGHPVTNVMVGDQVKHEWKCDSAYGNPNVHATYGMLVHNCFVEDGKGEKHMVIDERGYWFLHIGDVPKNDQIAVFWNTLYTTEKISKFQLLYPHV
jgi:hypothetical protein